MSVAAVRTWWRVQHPPPSLGKRLDVAYTAAIVTGILGSLVYGTASSALAQVVTVHVVAVLGPPVALVAVMLVAQWGAYQGPVVFSVPDVTHLLGAPLSRRALAVRRLARSLALGALAAALAGGIVLVGLGGQGRGVRTADALGVLAGLAELGVLVVAATWAVERSARVERLVLLGFWPAAVAAVALGAASNAGGAGRQVALWSGPWGWALQPIAGVPRGQWAAALVALTVLTAAAAIAALRDAGNCPAERHLRRAEGRADAVASLMSYDARTARRGLEAAGPARAVRTTPELRRLRTLVAGRPAAAVVWRDAVALARAPGRAAEACALVAAGTVLAIVVDERLLAVAAAMLVVYAGAARLLPALRAELDAPSRARILLRPRLGRLLLVHGAIPAAVVLVTALLAALGCAVAGAVPSGNGGGAAAASAVLVAPLVVLCAAVSARRGGRVPQTLLMNAMVVDPTGGGVTVLSWAAAWPLAAAVVAGAPVALAARGSVALPGVVVWCVVAGTVLALLLDRDLADDA